MVSPLPTNIVVIHQTFKSLTKPDTVRGALNPPEEVSKLFGRCELKYMRGGVQDDVIII